MQTGMASKLYTWPEKERFNIKNHVESFMAGWTNIKTIRKKKKSKLQPRRSRVTQTPPPVWKRSALKRDAEMLRHTEEA